MWSYYVFGTSWELWAVPCHNQPPINLKHEGFYWWCYMQSQYWFIWSLSPVEFTSECLSFSLLNLFSYQCLCCQIGLADPQHTHDMCNQENSSKTGRPVFVQQNWHSGSMLCKAALHVEGCAWGANLLLNTFKSPWRLLTHPWLQLCCPLLQVLEKNVRVSLTNVC